MARSRIVDRDATLGAAVALKLLGSDGVLIGTRAGMRALILLDRWLVLSRGRCILETVLFPLVM